MRGLVIALAALTAACATPEPTPQASQVYADFLIGRLANSRDDYDAAADRYFAALARSPGDRALVEGAMAATLSAGDEARARRAAAMAGADAPALARLVRGLTPCAPPIGAARRRARRPRRQRDRGNAGPHAGGVGQCRAAARG